MAKGARAMLVLAGAVLMAIALYRFGNPTTAQSPAGQPHDRLIPRPTPPAVARLSLPPNQESAGGAWVSLVEQPWTHASTGWLVLADRDLPLRNWSFTYGPMVIAGVPYRDGISTYPFSEIVYPLQQRALRFTAAVGVTDDSRDGAGSVRFTVYGDEFILWTTEVIRAGEPAAEIDISVEGITELRLVVDDAGDGSLGDYALWAHPRLLLTDREPSRAAAQAIEEARAAQRRRVSEFRAAEREVQQALTEADRLALTEPPGPRTETRGWHHSPTGMLVIANSRVAATLGYGGPHSGRISIFRRGEDAPVLTSFAPSVTTRDGRSIRLSDLEPERAAGFAFRPIDDPITGRGTELRAAFRLVGTAAIIAVTLTVFEADPAVSLGLATEGIHLQSVDYLGDEGSATQLGEDVRYLSDRSHLYRGRVLADGHLRRAPLEATKPALLWSEPDERGLLLTVFDSVPSPLWLRMRRDPGAQAFWLGVTLTAQLDDFGQEGTAPPPLTIQLTEGAVGSETFARFRRISEARYPAAPWPPRLKYQWGSWYAFGPAVSAALLRPQIERIASWFGDLGRWQLVIDAGWHLQYGREEAELGTVDLEKFPEGIRGIADEAHARGMDVILYLGTGFIHDSPGDGGEWLGLRGLIERYPEWMIPFQHVASMVRRYLLDYRNPQVEGYVRAVVRDFFLVHGVDGVLLDGLADAEGQLIPRVERDRPQGPPHPLLPTLEIYRMVHDEARLHHPHPFIESGWLNPMAANPLAQVFRYGDEIDRVDSPYPFGGFLQRLDYAIFSRLALGQRAYVGTATGDPSHPEMRWWLQAAAALGAHATLSFDLTNLGQEDAARLRADLVALDPFRGATRFGPGLFPDTFATTRDGVIYLGVLNREPAPREVVVSLDPLGLAGRAYAALDAASGEPRRVDGDFPVMMPAQSFRLFVLRPDPGILWTNSALEVDAASRDRLIVTARGPADVPGALSIATPPPSAVLIDGQPLHPAAGPPQEGQYRYDELAGVLSVPYAHGAGRTIEVRR